MRSSVTLFGHIARAICRSDVTEMKMILCRAVLFGLLLRVVCGQKNDLEKWCAIQKELSGKDTDGSLKATGSSEETSFAACNEKCCKDRTSEFVRSG